MLRFFRYCLLFFTLGSISGNLYSTHLMGGSFTYEYMGQVGSLYKYKLKIQMFRDCYNSTTPFDNVIQVGIYANNTNKDRYDIISMGITDREYVNPPSGGSNCSFTPSVCIERGYYEKIIYLPYSSTGWHLLHQRCCRNNLENLKTNMGQSYYCFIPPQTYANSSPYFSGIPTPYLCANDSINISYSAVDPDGDSLVYVLGYPWQGGSDKDPAPTPPVNLTLPIQRVEYANGYSFNNPFGNGGFVSLNSQTGLVSLKVPKAGFFAFAVDVYEYRNGILLSRVRRDIELIVLNCPPNDPPRLIIPGNVTTYTVEEGALLRFNIPYTDKDTMDLIAFGDILDTTSEVGPPYASVPPVSGVDTIVTTFEWQTRCGQGRSVPYFFTVKVKDRGCPSKTTIDIFVIKVNKFKGPDSINGPQDVCIGDTQKYRLYGRSSGSLLNWAVNEGTLFSGQGKDSMEVIWNKSGLQLISAYETSRYGCGPVELKYAVNVHNPPEARAGPDREVCSGDTIMLGTSVDTLLYYYWFPGTHLNDDSIARPVFSFLNIGDTTAQFTYRLTVADRYGCNTEDSLNVLVKPQPDTFQIKGDTTPCYNGIFQYTALRKNNTYQWITWGGEQIGGNNTYKASIHWTDTSSGRIGVLETNSYGCTGDTSFLNVRIVRPLPVVYGPQVVCPNTVKVKYWSKGLPGSDWFWYVTNGKRTDNDYDNETFINWPDSGMAKVAVVEVTKEGCISDSAILPVTISYHLKTSPIFGDTFLCEFTSQEPYHVWDVSGSTYFWWVEGGQLAEGNGNARIKVNWGAAGNGLLKVLEKSYDSVNQKECWGDTVYRKVVINPLPHTSPIKGAIHVCEKDTVKYSVTGYDSSVFIWNISDSNIQFTGQGKPEITVYWQNEGIFTLSVYEVTKDSCVSDVLDTIVQVHPNPRSNYIYGDSTICFPDNKNILYYVKGFDSSSFNWQIQGGKFLSDKNQSRVYVEWTDVPRGWLRTREITYWGCTGNWINKDVLIDSLSPEMKVVTTLPENEKIIRADWSLINDQYFNRKTELYKKDLKSSWTLIDSFDKLFLSYVDKQVKTSENIYRYKVAVSNVCGKRFESPVHQSILLQGTKKNLDIELNWNSYIGWKNGVEKYEIVRKINNNNNLKYYKTTTDTFVRLETGLDGRIQCYRVVAYQKGKPSVQSWSNEVCFEFDPVLHVPNAFTPNGDGINDTFFVYAYNVKDFEMEIFNRWGESMYRTQNPRAGWDGTFKGEACPSGVYLVIIRYSGNTLQRKYVTSLTLLR